MICLQFTIVQSNTLSQYLKSRIPPLRWDRLGEGCEQRTAWSRVFNEIVFNFAPKMEKHSSTMVRNSMPVWQYTVSQWWFYLQLILTIQNLPKQTSGWYQCVFTGYGVQQQIQRKTKATKINDENISCETPFPNLLPDIPTGKGM